MTIKPVGPLKQTYKGDLSKIPPLFIGGAVFNQQFNDNPESLPVKEILKVGFDAGIKAIDTSPYYGPSEILLGNALRELGDEFPREEYFLVTKCGRIQLDEFDYDPVWIEKSVHRSLERLGTDYLDLVYLHDIEFNSEADILNALKQLKLIKDRGLIKNFGISGYPVSFLYHIALKVVDIQEIGPLDAVLSYSNFNLQNTKLKPFITKFYQECKLKKLLNGSILSMSLLRSQSTHAFHPASKELREKCDQVAKFVQKEYNMELADLATRYAMREFLPYGSIVLGVSNVQELTDAINQYWNVMENKVNDDEIISRVQELFGVHLNETWKSGIHPEFN